MEIIIFIILVFIVLLFMNTRVKFQYENQLIKVYIYKILILKLDINDTKKIKLDKASLKVNNSKYLKVLKSIDFKYINLKMCLLKDNYYNWAISYGIINGLLSLFKPYFESKDIIYNYQIDFYGKPYLKFESIFYFKLGKILIHIIKIRRKIHGKRSSD